MLIKLETYKCSTCKKNKQVSEFPKCKNTIGRRYSCKQCTNASNMECRKRKSSTISGHLRYTINHVKAGAVKRGLEFNITFDDLIELYGKQQGKCALSKLILTHERGNGRVKTNISIDRIDSTKGYTKDNIQLVCDVVNTMKLSLTVEELKYFCSLIVNN